MKSFLILSCFVALAFGQVHDECDCGAFVMEQFELGEVLPLPSHDLESCEEEAKCSELCTTEWESMTNGGDLCSTMPDGTEVGQDMCDTLAKEGHEEVAPEHVYLYYRLCEGPWEFDGITSKQELSCKAGVLEGC